MSDTSKLSLLGAKTSHLKFDEPSKDILEIFDNQHPENLHVVGLECMEFTSVCPMTGQPDFGTIHIAYIPNKLCVESKSLKLYLGSYRNHGSFHEDCVNQIANDISEVLNPRLIRVFGNFNVRGGIAIKPFVVKYDLTLKPVEKSELLELIQHFNSMSVN